MRFANLDLLGKLAPSGPAGAGTWPSPRCCSRCASLTAAMAKPTTDTKVPRDRATVMMAIDVSLSMRAEDVSPNRLEAAQAAAKEFVEPAAAADQPRAGHVLRHRDGRGGADHRPGRGAARDRQARAGRADRDRRGDLLLPGRDQDVPGAAAGQRPGRRQRAGPDRADVRRRATPGAAARSRRSARPSRPRSRCPRSPSAPTPATSIWRGSGSWCRSTTRSSRRSRTGTGGSYYAAASAEELSSVYRDLGSQIGYTTERREITTWFVGIGLLFAFGAAGVSLLWSNRLL